MEKEFTAETAATPDALFAVVADLATYPHWLEVVDTVEPTEETEAWIVTLKARVGPLSRSKRLRMVRVDATEGRRARFERSETDGKDHAPWVFDVTVDPVERPPIASRVVLRLGYGGAMWSGLLDGVLDSAASKATDRLREYVKR